MTPYYDKDGITIYHGDCLEVMSIFPDLYFDGIFADVPYGITACSWDSIIPLNWYIERNEKTIYEDEWLNYRRFDNYVEFMQAQEEWETTKKLGLWQHYKRVIKPRGAIVLTASQPFTSKLVMSNLDWFLDALVWDKVKPSTGLHAKQQPLNQHEDILIFGGQSCYYNPIMEYAENRIDKPRVANNGEAFGGKDIYRRHCNNGKKYPRSIIKISNGNQNGRFHPTQKPLALFSYLIRTYTNPGDIILDNTIGSGTTLVAAKLENRRAIGIDIGEEWCEIAVKRLENPIGINLAKISNRISESNEALF